MILTLCYNSTRLLVSSYFLADVAKQREAENWKRLTILLAEEETDVRVRVTPIRDVRIWNLSEME